MAQVNFKDRAVRLCQRQVLAALACKLSAAALGANTSLIGATNNMVTARIAERAGYPISYREFLKVGFPAAVFTLIVGTLWILIRFQEVLNGDDSVRDARW